MLEPFAKECPICQKPFKNRVEERKHAYFHRGERRTKNVHLRMQPSRHQTLERLARAYDMNVTEAIDHAIEETWNI